MNLPDKTLHQTDQDLVRSRDLSLKPSQPPTQVPGFSIEQFIGAGAYGEVWSGTEKKTGRRVAIKFYTRRSGEDVELLAREVEKLVALSADRYVVQLVDVNWQAEPPYFVMDYFEHGSLEDLLKKETTLPTAAAVDLFREIATGMMHLHGKGIFHCDLKPANVLLDQDGKPRLADFGQARLGTEKAPSLGTLFFMAPEQADLNAEPAAKWDVYALGSLLYCMLVGRPPYHCNALTEKIESSTSVEERLSEYNRTLREAELPDDHRSIPGVDRMLADIIDRAIAPNPRHRFDSVQGILFALRQRELARSRRPLLVLGLLGPLLLLTVMSMFSWFAWRQAYADTQSAIRDEAIEGNDFAAKLAARSAAEKIDQYFRVVEELARDPDFISDLERATSDAELNDLEIELDDPNNNADPAFDELREEYRLNEARQLLQPHLERRIKDPHNQYPTAASWFVNDRRGMQIGSVYAKTPDTITIGRNYSYRTYFHGEKQDRKEEVGENTSFEVEPLGVDRPIIDHPHLSAVFLSKGTFTWKVAFSVPVVKKPEGPGVDPDEEGEVLGIVACTVEMGNFVDFENGKHQYAMLIDGREGIPGDAAGNTEEYSSGVILEHPLFYQLVGDSKKVPKKYVDLKFLAEQEKHAGTDRQLFRDPIGELPQGEAYRRDWISAIEPVVSPRFASRLSAEEMDQRKEDESGLFVLVAEDFGEIIRPVNRLSSQLVRLAIYATMFFLIVAILMWLLVYRMLRDSNRNIAPTFAGNNDSTIQGISGTGGL